MFLPLVESFAGDTEVPAGLSGVGALFVIVKPGQSLSGYLRQVGVFVKV